MALTSMGAECVLECIASYPAAGGAYLAFESCYYCDYCETACRTSEYCAVLEAGLGGTAGSSAGGAGGND